MPRTYGTTNIAPYATAPAVGPAGDTYYNTGSKITYVSDGTQWNALQGAGGGGGGAPYAPVTGTSPPPSSPVITPPTGLLWVDTSTTPPWTPSVGPGVPAGGAIGSYLQKRSATDYDTQWASPASLLFYQTIPSLTVGSSPYPIPHNLGTRNVLVQLWDAVTGSLIGAQVQVTSPNAIAISVTQNAPNAVNVVVMGTANLAPPVNPSDIASKSYVDARTPNLPAPITSGSTIQSYTDPLGVVWVAKNGVNSGNWYQARDVLHCAYYRNAALNLVATTSTAFAMDTLRTANSDPYGLNNTSTGIFTIPIAGRWRADCQIAYTPTAVTQRGDSIIYYNGGAAAQNLTWSATASVWWGAYCWLDMPMVAGDQLQAVAFAGAALGLRVGLPSATQMTLDYLGSQ